jgi:hypothetical protein
MSILRTGSALDRDLVSWTQDRLRRQGSPVDLLSRSGRQWPSWTIES